VAEKWERLVEILADDDAWRTAGDLADRLAVTPRSIRSYVARANALGGRGPVILSGPQGYRLDRAAWAAGAAPLPPDTSPAARATGLVRVLIDADAGLDVHATAERLHVSEATVEADLRRIRSRLEGTGLSLARRGSDVTMLGPESARRRLLGALFREESARGRDAFERLRGEFPQLPEFREALVERLAAAGYAPNEYGLADVLLHIAIALDRTEHDHPIDAATVGTGTSDSSRLEDLLDGLIRAHFGRAIGDAELAHLARLLGTRAATMIVPPGGGAPASSRAALVQAIVAQAADEYLIELDDDVFIERLALHVDNLVVRASEQRRSRNPLAATIKAAYPLTYDLAVYIASELAQSEGIVVDEDEIAYIAMHVGAYLEQRRSALERVRVTVVAPAYHDVHTLLAERIRSEFGSDVELVELIDRADVDWAAIRAELIVTVIEPRIPLEHVVRLPPFPTDADLARVRAEISRIRRARRHARLAAALSRYISPDLFVRGMRGYDREELITMLGERMMAAGVIDRAYLDGALERERMSSTAFTEHLAVPHAMTMTAKHTAIAIAIDEVPIDWDGARVNVVALIAFSDAGRAEFQDVFDQFVETFSERENVQRLVRGATDYQGLLAELSRLMEPDA